jgi:hypothetical protein
VFTPPLQTFTGPLLLVKLVTSILLSTKTFPELLPGEVLAADERNATGEAGQVRLSVLELKITWLSP